MSKYLADIMLNNLISNSIRHNVKNGKINIVLNESFISVSNTGKENQLKSRTFERFAKSSESEGLGIGLAITKEICNRYSFELVYGYLEKQHSFKVYFKHTD
ncbi:MAG: hypothetical protein EOO93_10695 [Pedobacter sp.]|nr:MAG: hypothetical protein EOO93_10695 [Pedobacter sp.]